MNKGRLDYIDIAKGIGILLVLLGHLLPNESVLKSAIYSFHMPLFFVTYGIVMKQYSFKEIIKRRTQTILIPYVLWALIFTSFSYKNVLYIVYGTNETLSRAGSNAMLWFLVSMFVATCLGGKIITAISKGKESKQKGLLLIAAICTLLLGYGLNMLHNKITIGGQVIGLPWALDVSLLATAFVLFGKLFYISFWYKLERVKAPIRACIGILMSACSIIGIFEKSDKGYPQMATYDIGNPILYFIIACISCIGILLLSSVIEQFKLSKLLVWLGKHTLLIFIMHRTIVYYCKDFYAIHSNMLVGAAMWIVMIIYSSAAAVVIEIFCPLLAGKSRTNK